MAFLVSRFLKQRSETMARHFFNVDGYNRYGLYHDDLIDGFHVSIKPKVSEAYRRLIIDQPELHDARVFRSLRANQLKLRKEILPKEQWVTFEEDQTKGMYLQKYLEQIEKEEQEKSEFAMLDSQ